MKKLYIGVDVSKKKIDVAYLLEGQTAHKVFENNLQGFQSCKAWLIKKSEVPQEHWQFCYENMGLYAYRLQVSRN